MELPRIKHHAMITRLDELENTPKIDLRTRSVIKSGYKYEHIKSGSQESIVLDKSSKKFMSIAEKVRNFFNNTPPRFRSKPTIPAGESLLSGARLMTSCFLLVHVICCSNFLSILMINSFLVGQHFNILNSSLVISTL